MKILVTGHRGFIGKNLVDYIKKHTNWQVDGWEWATDEPDVSNYGWVIHLGAISATTERNVDLVMEQNLEFSQKLYSKCCEHGVNFQYASSASVYGSETTDFREDSPKNPQSAYAWSKYLFDRWLSHLSSPIVVHGFRYFNVYGNQEEHKKNMASPVTKFTQQAQNGGPVILFENSNDYRRDFVCVDDVCRAHVEFIKNVHQNGVWNIGTGEAVSFFSIARAISAKYNVPIKEIPMPTELKAQYQKFTKADLTLFNKVLPDFNWIGVVDWIKNN